MPHKNLITFPQGAHYEPNRQKAARPHFNQHRSNGCLFSDKVHSAAEYHRYQAISRRYFVFFADFCVETADFDCGNDT